MRDFEWRSALGNWRWLILGSVGLQVGACGGRSSSEGFELDDSRLGQSGSSQDPDDEEGILGGGGVPNRPSIINRGSGGSAVAGSAGYSGYSGSAGSAAFAGYSGSAGSASTAGSAGSAGSAGTPSYLPPPPCESPVALGGGWVRCENSMIHRAALGACISNLPRPEPAIPPELAEAGYASECQYDSDCTLAAHGHCERSAFSNGAYCEYGCTTNAECESGHVCACDGGDIGTCLPASCTSNADCEGGYLCASYSMEHACGGTEFACQTPFDLCVTNDDCRDGDTCTLDFETGRRVCAQSICEIGRPFLVEGHERLACAVERADWYSIEQAEQQTEAQNASAVDPELAAALAARWLEQGLMEHASVAAFARFAMQLLALGAPPGLVERASAAMQDELGHARDCFRMARRFTNHDVGPGPLQISGALDSCDLPAIVVGTVLEGCIGETVAAIEASEALARCEDAEARPVLERIQREETRHAELAWQFVAWALAAADSWRGPGAVASSPGAKVDLTALVEATFERELQTASETARELQPLERALSSRGQLATPLRLALRARVLREVIAPCARALIAAAAPPRARARADIGHEFHPPRES